MSQRQLRKSDNMPELPEVETVRRYLATKLTTEVIKKIELNETKALKSNNLFALLNLENKTILNFSRKAKYLILNLSDDYHLVLHLRMEGKFYLVDLDNHHYDRFNILTLKFANKKLLFNDHRKFATVDLFTSTQALQSYLTKIGAEPFDINLRWLYEQIKTKRTPIKTILLDQKYMSGLGNIYVDEVLFAAKISPLRLGKDLQLYELAMLLTAAQKILAKAIEYKGTTIKTFTSQAGVFGNYQQFLQVHQQTAKLCPDGSEIVKIKVGGRGTYYCPNYQK